MWGSAMCLALWGCGEPGVSGGVPQQEDVTPGTYVPEELIPGVDIEIEDRSHLLQNAAFTQDMLRESVGADGILEIRPEHHFLATRLFMDTLAFPDVEIAYIPVGGEPTKFEPIEYTIQDESGELLAEIFYPGLVEAIQLRFNFREEFEGPQAEEAIRYLDARFYAEAMPGESLPLHLEEEHGAELELDEEDVMLGEGFLILSQRIGLPGDWNPAPEVVRRGDEQYVAYEGSPTRPYGGARPGTLALKRYVQQNFPGVSTIGDYRVSRINGSNRYSVHSDGRALDIMIPMADPRRCGADNTVGDALAAWLINNAEHIGVTFIIWERKSWNPSRARGRKFRPYNRTGCTLQHADHVHVEISSAAGAQQTPFFRNMGGGVAPQPGSGSGEPPPISCSSATLGRSVDENTCVQQRSAQGCGIFKCTGYNSYTRLSDFSSCGESFAHATCGAAPTPTPQPDFTCPSATLGRRVDENACVQQASSRGCGWFKCTSPGSYTRLGDASSCGDEIYSNSTCGPTPTPGAARTNQLVMTIEWTERVDLDINVEEPSGRLISYGRSERSPDDGNLALCDPTNTRRACYNDATFKETIVWGEVAGRVQPGEYKVSVRNFDEPNTASFTIKAELYDAEGQVTEVGSFTGSSTTYQAMQVGTVTVP